jgi:hypothetical protein
MSVMGRADALDEAAREVLRANDRGGYTVPCDGLYPFQWNWDSAFAAWGWSTFDVDRAWTELEVLFTGQWQTGMLPHIVFHRQDAGYFPGPGVWSTGHDPPTSGITQPPVLATLAREIAAADPSLASKRLPSLYPKLIQMHRWWHDVRCREGVAATVHPWESGRDNAAAWDRALAAVDTSEIEPYERRDTGHVDAGMRPRRTDYDRYVALVEFGRSVDWDDAEIVARGPFLVADPAITFLLIRANRDLAALGAAIGEDPSEPLAWSAELSAGVTRMWNDDLAAYDSVDLRTGEFGGSATSSMWMEFLALHATDVTDRRLAHMWDAVESGIPTHDPTDAAFERQRYWRGPVWPVVNSLIARGLLDSGRTQAADRLRKQTADLIRSGGLAEYFDPVDGAPCGGRDFTWTAAIWLAWASPNAPGYRATT